MLWLRNPFSRPEPGAEAADAEALPEHNSSPPPPPNLDPANSEPHAEPDPAPRPSQDVAAILSHFKTPTKSLSGHQIFYIFVIDGIGAGILSGGINFAIAYAMYTTQDTTSHPIRLFALPNTLAGDAAVTILVQSLITWLIECFLVRRDLDSGGVSPVGFLPPPTSPFLRGVFLLDEDEDDDDDDEFVPGAEWGKNRGWMVFLVENAVRAMATAVVGFVLLWPASVGVLMAVGRREGGDWVFADRWAPQVFKLVLGGVWALLQTPVCAGFWLVREGWVLQGKGGGGEGVGIVRVDDRGGIAEDGNEVRDEEG